MKSIAVGLFVCLSALAFAQASENGCPPNIDTPAHQQNKAWTESKTLVEGIKPVSPDLASVVEAAQHHLAEVHDCGAWYALQGLIRRNGKPATFYSFAVNANGGREFVLGDQELTVRNGEWIFIDHSANLTREGKYKE